MPQAQRLLVASFSKWRLDIAEARKIIAEEIKDLEYHTRRNYAAYKSHRKKKIMELLRMIE